MNSSSEGFSELLQRVVAKYPEDQIGQGLTQHITREGLESRIPKKVEETLSDVDVVVKSSAGQGRWTSIPWVAIMDPRKTTRIRKGIYVVYLFEPQEDRVTLTLNQGVTDLKDEVGSSAARIQLKETARKVRRVIQPSGFSSGPLEFPHASQRNKLYGPGTIFYKRYHLGDIPSDEELRDDLRILVEGYQEYISGDSSSKSESTPTVYQAPIKASDGPIRTKFERTIMNGVSREQLEDIVEVPVDHAELRVWGNRGDEPAEEGDYLLFADCEGRYDGAYTLLARVTHATVLDKTTARRVTDAVGWGEETDTIFPHVMFLKPVYKADVDRERLWNLLNFKGWPNDTYSAINFDRDGSMFFSEYDSAEQFLEEIKGREIYPESSIIDPADEYDTLDEAIMDVRDRLKRTSTDTAWLKRSIGEAIVQDWSNALKGFRPSDEVSRSTATKFDQLRAVYEYLESALTEMADELGIGSHHRFTPTKVLFLAWFRILQEDLDLDGAPLSQPRLNSILRNTYTVPSDEGDKPLSEINHPLAEHILKTQPTVHKFTAPPDYWLTTYEYAALGFEESDLDDWRDLQAGDVILFHSTASPGWEDLDNQDSGLVGAGIVRAKTTKPDDDTWWFDERDGRPKDNSFPYLVAFERLYATGNLDAIDFTSDIYGKSPSTVNTDLNVLTEDILEFSDVNEISEEVHDVGFPRHQTIESLDYEPATAIVTALVPDLHEVSPIALDKPFEGKLDADEILTGLHFPDSLGEEIIAQIEGALRAGKHTILTGPPGTGKTEIARRVGEYLAEEYPYLYSGSQITTATADWSTFDTVGGYMPNENNTDGDHLEFSPGLVLNRFKMRSENVQRNESLVIDELNRADIDKAFGQLFTVLSGQPVQLPYTKNGEEVEIAPVTGCNVLEPHEYRIPQSWSLFATLNTYDKTSLYEMSYAFMRRFSFIRVPAPRLKALSDTALRSRLEEYVDVWGINVQDVDVPADTDPLLDVAQVWQAANGAIDDRAIGPAVVKDILEYLVETTLISWRHGLTQAVISYILPQLEGVPKRNRVVRDLANVDPIMDAQLDSASRDMLQVAAIQDRDE